MELAGSLVDEQWERIDPTLPDARGLFVAFDRRFFDGCLAGAGCEVNWSTAMARCAGKCHYRGGRCTIKLSQPLLKLRPRKDLVETLLHEMIHAYLFVTENDRVVDTSLVPPAKRSSGNGGAERGGGGDKRTRAPTGSTTRSGRSYNASVEDDSTISKTQVKRDRNVHDEPFLSHMRRINAAAGTNISVHHLFYDAAMEGSLVDEQWERIDPTPDARGLFAAFNRRFFDGCLAGCKVIWSTKMTFCAGKCHCHYDKRGGRCTIKLSRPLLKLRPRKDLVETLLHEMIHAYLFVTENKRRRNVHDEPFLAHMRRINEAAGTNVTEDHRVFEEVALYQRHVWRCDGPCRSVPPRNGYWRRAANRPPGPTDWCWREHMDTCGGTYHKVSEPADYARSKGRKSTVTLGDDDDECGDTATSAKVLKLDSDEEPVAAATGGPAAADGQRAIDRHHISDPPKIEPYEEDDTKAACDAPTNQLADAGGPPKIDACKSEPADEEEQCTEMPASSARRGIPMRCCVRPRRRT